ncbi:MAG: glycosyltransferase family 2 protein [Polyangiaceae bacterium]
MEGGDAWVALSVLASVAYAAWSLSAARGLWTLRTLREVSAPAPDSWPKLSVIVPACNEGATLERALATLLQQDYPDLEIILVDDRSSDGTSSLVDELAARDPRIRAHHVQQLPEGWLGKVNAIREGYARSEGEWVLFSDADVHYHQPDVLRRAVALGLAERLDHVCLLPRLKAATFWQETAIDAFGIGFFTSIRAHELKDPDSDRFVGIGAFNLVRRTALERSEGLAWLRLEVADDVGLGLLIRQARGRAGLWLASRELSVLWYPSLPAMVRGLEKNLFAIVGRFAPWRALLRTLPVVLLLAAIAIGFFLPSLAARTAAGFALMSVAVTAYSMHRRIDQAFLPGLFVPVGILLLVFMVVRSTWVCSKRGGITWRGTFYPTEHLRELQRVKL